MLPRGWSESPSLDPYTRSGARVAAGKSDVENDEDAGRPANGRIHLSKADVTATEEMYVLAALRSGWVAPAGPDLDKFESEVAERVGVQHAVALSSGTAALHLALLSVGAGPGTLVVCPTLTFAASANAIVYTGATPVFVDAKGDDGNVDPGLLLEAVDALQREGRQVAAAMAVDLFGRCADYAAFRDELEQRGVPLVEDAAEALGAYYENQAAGSFGVAAALSFNGNKIMTTSGGGMLLCDDAELAGRARFLSTQAREPVPWYEHDEVGYNYRLSNILAALGRAQLSRLDSMIARRRQIRCAYRAGLEDIDEVRFLGETPSGRTYDDNCWLSVIRIDTQSLGKDPDTVVKDLDSQGIEARHVWKPMHMQPVFEGARTFANGTAERLFATGLTLPSGSGLTDDEIGRVVDALHRALVG